MTEHDLFNRDAMFWREINFSSPNAIAEITLVEPISFDGQEMNPVICSLLPFEAHKVEYDLGEGGSFLKNEVKLWPLILLSDLDFYNDKTTSEPDRQSKLRAVMHENVQRITLKDQAGKLIVKKAKI